ncbi:HAMP domain-containing sensor histidine kinase [Sphingobium sp. AN558]|uniref:sensor histidine kinase n=1 Tax=Sphingobium sp. AN558 TaxID=3133442 RepID=UPI0030C3771A
MLARLRLFTRSTTARFVALAFLFQAPVTGGLLIFVQQASERALLGEEKALVAELRDELRVAFRDGGEVALARLIRQRLNSAHGGTAVILLADRSGARIAGNIEAWPAPMPARAGWTTIDLRRIGNDLPEHMGVVATMLPGGAHLLTGHVIDAGVTLARVNRDAVIVALALGIVLSLACALVLGQTLSRRIKHIVATSVAVGDGQFTHRVPVDGSGDAFDALGQAINAMLERIEALVSQLRLMTDGLAHDLRSPVTRLKSVLERAILDVHDPLALAALDRVADEAETLLSMLSVALQIARADAGIGRVHFADADVRRLLADLAEVYGPLVEDQGFEIGVIAPEGLVMPLHRELMSQAIGNLIENALKYGTGGHWIRLAVDAGHDRVDFSVSDDGPGIPADRHADALRRFGRLDPARQAPGSGLGLTLAGAVARLHGGTIALEDAAPGLRVRLSLPR